MSKQTSTEWLFKKLWDEPKDKLTWYAILEKAKEMEEQQTIDAYVIGAKNQIYGVDLSGLEYYNKTFKN